MADHDHPPHEPPHEPPHGGPCQACPVCLLIGGVGVLNPEARAHLRAAGRELALALRAALDGLAGDDADPPPGAALRRIDLDDS